MLAGLERQVSPRERHQHDGWVRQLGRIAACAATIVLSRPNGSVCEACATVHAFSDGNDCGGDFDRLQRDNFRDVAWQQKRWNNSEEIASV